ncbi:MAG: class I SAM-dependent methyltransferase [Xanthobacteraceae bacterium]|jgi:predicted O-methyltransferase YrrM
MRASATTLEAEMTPEEAQALDQLLQSSNLRGTHLEIGTAAGGTLKRMVALYPKETRPRFVVVDTMKYFPDQMGIVARNLHSVGVDPSDVDFRVGDSWSEFRKAEAAGEQFDFMLIDASHKLNHVTRDLSWTRMLKVGGYVAMHDYAPKFPGVTQAADKFLARYPSYSRVKLTGSLLILKKNAMSAAAEVSAGDRFAAEIGNFFQQLGGSVRKRIGSRS